MRLNPKLILILSVITGLTASLLSVQILKGLKKEPLDTRVVTAIHDMTAWDVIEPEDVQLLLAPIGTDLQTTYLKLEDVVGRGVRKQIGKGRAVSRFDLIDKNDSLAGLIPEGYRATTLPLYLPAETLRFVKSGNRVDILFIDDARRGEGPKVIMKNIRVLNIAKQPSESRNAAGDILANVTLAVRPEGAEMLTYAANKGKLSFTVRPISDEPVDEFYMSLNDLLGVKQAVLPMLERPAIEIIKGNKKMRETL